MSEEFNDIYISEAVDSKEYDYEGDMAKTQLVTIADAAEELHDLLEDDENMPEWCQNKITKAMDYLDTVRDYMISKDTEEEPGDENPNESLGKPVQRPLHKGATVKGKFGGKVTSGKVVDHEIVQNKAGVVVHWKSGEKGRFPNDHFDTKGHHKSMNEEVEKIDEVSDDLAKKLFKARDRNLANAQKRQDTAHQNLAKVNIIKKKGGYASANDHNRALDRANARLNKAKDDVTHAKKKWDSTARALDKRKQRQEQVELGEGNMASAAKELEAYARKSGGIDKNDFMKAVMMMKRNQTKQLNKFVDELDTEPREKIQSVIQKHIKEAYSEPQGQAKRMLSPLQKMRMDKEKKDRDRDGKLKPGVIVKKEQVEEGAMKRIAQAQGGTKPDRSDAAVNKGGLQTFKKKPTTEKLKVSDGVGAWIEDFYKSNAPQFKGKSREERRDMALAAYLSAKDNAKNEDV